MTLKDYGKGTGKETIKSLRGSRNCTDAFDDDTWGRLRDVDQKRESYFLELVQKGEGRRRDNKKGC